MVGWIPIKAFMCPKCGTVYDVDAVEESCKMCGFRPSKEKKVHKKNNQDQSGGIYSNVPDFIGDYIRNH